MNGVDTPQPDLSQKKFCDNPKKTLRLLAPAGSGKTLAILHRCLTQQKGTQDKQRFLIFTFTRGARDELKDRINHNPIFKDLNDYTEITTLNSWGYRRIKLRRTGIRLITEGADQYNCVYHILRPVWIKHKVMNNILTNSRFPKSREIMELIDYLKSLGFRHDAHNKYNNFKQHLIWLDNNGLRNRIGALLKLLTDLEIVSLGNDPEKNQKVIFDNFVSFWCEACVQMDNSAVFTLEDQKYWALLDIEKDARTGKYTTGMHRYNHIIVDEFQDINVLDLKLLKAIAAINKTDLTIVGDDDQAIYEWRGATPAFILNPDEHINPGYETHLLDINYRSPRNIVDLSQRLIKNNKNRVQKNVKAHTSQEAKVEVVTLSTLNDALDYVVTRVNRTLNNHAFKRMAIIGRKRSQIIPYQIVFASKNIPFYAAEDLQLFLGKAFKDLKGILAIKARAESNPMGTDVVGDMLTLCNIVRRFPLSNSDKSALQSYLFSYAPSTLVDALYLLNKYTGPLKGSNKGGEMSHICYGAILSLFNAETVSDAIDAISENFDGMQKDYGKAIDDIFFVDPPFLHLSEYAQRYGTDYNGFSRDVDKAIATLVKLPPEEEETVDEKWKLPLHLMTALRAKGKEFDVVMILDANDNIWPNRLAVTEDEIEEERRIFYVAITRARKELVFLVNKSILGNAVLPTPYLAEMGIKA